MGHIKQDVKNFNSYLRKTWSKQAVLMKKFRTFTQIFFSWYLKHIKENYMLNLNFIIVKVNAHTQKSVYIKKKILIKPKAKKLYYLSITDTGHTD